MGVVKNLMVRIGADVRGFLGGMKSAANTTSTVSQTVNKHTSSIKKAVTSSFSSSKMTVREYAAAISKTKENYTVAAQNTERLSDKISELKSVYDTIKNATEGIDLSTPLVKQIKETEESYRGFLDEAQKTKEALSKALNTKSKKDNSAEVNSLRKQLESIRQKAVETELELKNLKQASDTMGTSNIGFASVTGLQQLESQIQSIETELSTTKTITAELSEKLKSLGITPTLGQEIKGIGNVAAYAAGTGLGTLWQKIKSLGVSAAQVASNGVKRLGSGLKSLAGSAIRGITSIPSKLRSIGSSAASSCGGLGKMVKSIRNIGIASLGMKIVSGLFGKLRSIISSYVSQNEELNTSVTAMKNQLGEALLPAINLVMTAMQKLMPVVTAVSNGINSVLTSLFGDMLKTTSAIKKAADEANSLEIYGFDQITKASDTTDSSSTSSSTSGGSQSALVQKLTGWIQRLKDAFVAGDWKRLGQIIGDGINSVFDSINAIDVGAKIGAFTNNLITTAYGVLSTVNFSGIGSRLGQMLTSAIAQVDWSQAGATIGLFLTALPSTLVGFILGTDWTTVGQSVSDLLKSALSTVTQWIQNTDWLQIGQSAADLLTSIDWGGIVSETFKLLGAVFGACVGLIWGAIDDTVTSIKDYFAEKIQAAGGNVGKGLLNGILEGLGKIGTWISNNITKPFVAGFSGLGNGVVDVIEKMINTVIGGINKLFSGLNQFLALGKKVGLNLAIPTLSEVKLPRAATGTVVSRATDLTVGEDGTEAVVPLERHTEWLDVLASKLAVKTSGGIGGGSITIQVILGGRKVTEYVVKDINQITRENGVCPIRL